MSAPAMNKYGLFSARDSGPPPNKSDYTTLIIFHGLGWHSAVFEKLFPLVSSLNVRLVAANRPDYPGSTPLSDVKRKQLNDITKAAEEDSELAADALINYIEADSRDAYDFLADFMSKESIPVKGGIIVAGWSFGAVTILGLLTIANTFSSKKVDLRSYIRHFVLYEAPSHLLGYQPPPNVCNPFFNQSLASDEILKIFPKWLSGYYAHGEDLKKLEYNDALTYPPPTILTMDPFDVQRCLEVGPVLPGGSDERVLNLGVQLRVFARVKEAAIYLDINKERGMQAGNRWDDVEIKHVWCDQSAWEMPWGTVCLQADLDESKKAGRVTRKIDMVRLRGGNHFCHWDRPELALTGLLSGL